MAIVDPENDRPLRVLERIGMTAGRDARVFRPDLEAVPGSPARLAGRQNRRYRRVWNQNGQTRPAFSVGIAAADAYNLRSGLIKLSHGGPTVGLGYSGYGPSRAPRRHPRCG